LPAKSADAQAQSLQGREAPHAHSWRGYFLIAAATCCWAGAATVGKAVFNGKLFAGRPLISPLALTQARTTFTVLLLATFLLLRFGPGFFRIRRRELILCVVAGTLGTAGSNFFYYYAVEKSTVAIAITLQYTAPVWVLLAMALIRRERPSRRRVAAVLLALVGIALTVGLFQSDMRPNAAGAAAAMVASFSFAFYNLLAPGLVKRNHPLQVMLYALLGAAILWAAVNPPWRWPAQHLSRGQWEFLFLFACLSMLLPYVLYFNGLKYLDPTRAVVASCLEPVFAVVFAAVFVGEVVNALRVVGILAVLAATVMAQAHKAPAMPRADLAS
jgi:drug/metabolite transporter (DMT)-like permease